MIKTNPDKKSAELQITGTFTTDELQSLIADLIVVRAQLLPAVPFTHEMTHDEARISLQDDPYLSLGRLPGGKIRLWLRNAGLGWMVFNLPADKAIGIRDYLIASTSDVDPGTTSLVSQKFPDGSKPN